MQGLIDTHFHLDMYKNHAEIFEYLNDNHIYTLVMTNSPGVYLGCKQMYNRGKYVRIALGFHPLNNELQSSDFEDFLRILPQVDYVGEIGLDFSGTNGVNKQRQIEYFDIITEKCSYMNKLMSVHIRQAEDIACEIIEKYRPAKCIIHWYNGNIVQLNRLIECGCYFSVNGNMAVSKKGLIQNIPRNRILIESDGPYSKIDGKKFQPQMLLREYEIIARTLNEPNLISIVYDNFRNVLTMNASKCE